MTIMHLPAMPSRVTVVEVGPRDGLQNEPTAVGTDDKVRFINLLSASGLPVIETSAFVSPKWVPQMADADEVVRRIERRSGVRYSALTPNAKGLARALDAGIDEVAVFAAASETFSRKNINQSIDDALASYADVCSKARSAGVRVRGYVSTCFGCPYEGSVAPARVADVAARLFDCGVEELAISDTIGVAHPGQVPGVVEAVAAHVPIDRIALHFHDTRGTALANVLAGLVVGITVFDASAGGLGGCPFAPGAAGNLATEDLVYMLDGLGIQSGVDLGALTHASHFMESRLGRPMPSRYLQAVAGRRAHAM